MIRIITGITETDNVNYCPRCGTEVGTYYGDGTAKCDECDFHFGVLECEED